MSDNCLNRLRLTKLLGGFLKRLYVLLLVFALLLAGCIKGSATVEKEKPGMNKTESQKAEVENKTVGSAQKNESSEVQKEPERFFPWGNGFKDLDSFYMGYYYLKSAEVDRAKDFFLGRAGSLIPTGAGGSSIIKIWFLKKEGRLRVDIYEEDYDGKEFCQGSPTEFIKYGDKTYALTSRRLYKGSVMEQWQHTVASKSISEGNKETWKCELKHSSDTIQGSIDKPSEAIDYAFDLYANKYAKPGFYAGESDYDKEVEQTKARWKEYYARNGAAYVRETNAIKQTEPIIGRTAADFYITRFEGYGVELRDLELGLGLQFIIERFVDGEKEENAVVLEEPILVYKMLEFDQKVDKSVFDLK